MVETSCREGTCASCETPVIEGRSVIATRCCPPVNANKVSRSWSVCRERGRICWCSTCSTLASRHTSARPRTPTTAHRVAGTYVQRTASLPPAPTTCRRCHLITGAPRHTHLPTTDTVSLQTPLELHCHRGPTRPPVELNTAICRLIRKSICITAALASAPPRGPVPPR